MNGVNSDGADWYAVENGRYYLEKEGVEKCAEYLRIPVELAKQLDATSNDLFKYQLFNLGIVDIWHERAKKAIARLEELCGRRFEDYDKPSRVLELTEEEKKDVETKIAEGFFTPSAIAKRKEEKETAEREKKRREIEDYYTDKIKAYSLEKAVMLKIFDLFGTTDNVILYSHRNTLCFNYSEPQWATYKKHWTEQEFARFNRECDELIGYYSINTEFKYQY